MVLADGKNKGLHFSKNNVVGRKERKYTKMEVVLGAQMLSQLLPHCLCFHPYKGEWARAESGGKVIFFYFVRTHINIAMCLCAHIHIQ